MDIAIFALYAGGCSVAPSFIDSKEDQAAIGIGIDLATVGSNSLCSLVEKNQAKLNKDGTKGARHVRQNMNDISRHFTVAYKRLSK